MAAQSVKAIRDEDGGATLYATVDGVTVAFATVNPSQFVTAAAEQGVTLKDKAAGDDGEGEG